MYVLVLYIHMYIGRYSTCYLVLAQLHAPKVTLRLYLRGYIFYTDNPLGSWYCIATITL